MLVAVIVLATQFIVSGLFRHNMEDLSDQFDYQIPYNLTDPDKSFKLKHRLDEISGLTAFGKKKLLALQDEEGYIYTISASKGEIKDKLKYTKSGDYEGIALAGEVVYTLRSDGTIYQIDKFSSGKPKIEAFKTALTIANDAEGLCYDPAKNRLLIACKGAAGIDNKLPGKKAIYAFYLDKKELDPEPLFLLDLDEINSYTGKTKGQFSPSGIAVHPTTGDVYIIAAVGDLLVVLDNTGSIKTMDYLTPKLFKQPEGITFLPNGELLISNEAHHKGSKSTILRFKQKSNG